MTRKLTNALLAQKRKTQATVPEIYGTLGIPIGGIRAVEVSGRNSYVYVKLRDNPNEVIQAFNNKVAPSYNLPVVVLREGNRYIVAKVNSERYENNWNNSAPYLPAHGGSHSFPEGGGADVTWVFSRQFMPFLAFPSTYSGTVTISPHVISNPAGNWMYVGNTGTASLLGYIPTGTDQSIMALIYMDSRTGNPGYLIGSGTPFSNNITGTQDVYSHVPPLSSPSTQIPIVAVRINTGTTGVGWDNLYDMRQWLHATPSGTSSGGVDTIGVIVWDEGIPQGTGTVLNFVGGGVTASRSGTVISVSIPTGFTGTTHNSLFGLQGGTTGEYYHLTSGQYTQVVNADGWVIRDEVWTRTGNHTFTVSGDLTEIFRKGTKIRYKDGGASFEYGVVYRSSYSNPTTTVTLITNTDYTMAAATITDRYVSYIENPSGFPTWFNYSPTWGATLGMTYTSVTTQYARWRAFAKEVHAAAKGIGTTGVTGTFTLTATLPVDATLFSGSPVGLAYVNDNAAASVAGFCFISTSPSSIVNGRKYDSANFGLGVNRQFAFDVQYEY